MGIRTPVSHNCAMTLGGLKQGVTPLDMAHAYETFASGGKLDLRHAEPGRRQRASAPVPGPVGIERDPPRARATRSSRSSCPTASEAVNERQAPAACSTTASPTRSARSCRRVVKDGTGTRARRSRGIVVAGKTGTTEDYGDAWFVGWTPEYTVAVWVGYPDKFKPMKTEFQGEPVAGGTFPAAIWQTFMKALLQIDAAEPKDDAPTARGRADAAGHRRPAPGHAADAATAAPPTERRRRRQRRRRRRRRPHGARRQPTTAAPAPTGADRRHRRADRRRGAGGTGGGAGHRPGYVSARSAGRPRPRHAARAGRAEAPRAARPPW